MSKFRGSITFPIFSLSTLSRQHYCSPPKTRYCWLVRPSQTGFSPARLPALRLGAQFPLPQDKQLSSQLNFVFNIFFPLSAQSLQIFILLFFSDCQSFYFSHLIIHIFLYCWTANWGRRKQQIIFPAFVPLTAQCRLWMHHPAENMAHCCQALEWHPYSFIIRIRSFGKYL